MCGLVGIITAYKNGFSSDETGALNDLLYMDALRGVDATGIMYGDSRNNIQVYKEATEAAVFMKTKEWENAKMDILRNGRWAFGHNRAATRGSKTDKNAHPFPVDDKIILMQNGTYRGSHTHHKDTEVDTEACAHVISEAGDNMADWERKDVENALKKINAAYAFIWWNNDTKCINIIRNSERPLWFATTEQGSMFFASEGNMLWAAAMRNSIKFDKDGVRMLLPETLLTYDFSNSSVKFTETITKLDCSFRSTYTASVYDPSVWRAKKQEWTPKPEKERTTALEWVVQLGDAVAVPKESVTLNQQRAYMAANKDIVYTIFGQDYQPVYPHDTNNNTWYVFGTIVSDDMMNGTVVFWTIECNTTMEALAYTTSNSFSAKLDYLIQRGHPDNTKNTWYSCCTVKDLQVVEQLVN